MTINSMLKPLNGNLERNRCSMDVIKTYTSVAINVMFSVFWQQQLFYTYTRLVYIYICILLLLYYYTFYFQNKGMKIVRQLQEANKYRMAAFACDPSSNTAPENDLINQRQIAHLENRREPLPPPPNLQPSQPAIKKIKRNTLTMHVLDISTVLNGNAFNYVSWLCPRLGETTGAPEELVMYSLVKGNGELIMFGGVHNDISYLNYSEQQSMYSNSLHFISPPRDII